MPKPMHAESLDKVFTSLKAGPEGLSSAEAAKRLEDYGRNILPEPEGRGMFRIFISQFASPLIYVLFAAAAVIFYMGETADAAVILFVLLFNAVIGSVQEGRAQNTLAALRKLTDTQATVLRDGKVVIISGSEVVPGDIVILQEGEKVPADCRLITGDDLKADESSLTGESVPVHKTPEESAPEAPLAERHNMLWKGTNVVNGRGRAVALFTGEATEIGKISRTVASLDTDVPLKSHIKALSELVIGVVVLLSIVLFIAGYAAGASMATMFATVVSLAVSIIPEGLPIVMTVVLAAGVWRMAKRDVLVKKLQAVEALGQARVIAVDKTGTLTQNQMMVEAVYAGGKMYSITGRGYEPEGEALLEDEAVNPANHSELLMAGRIAAFCADAKLMFVESSGEWKVAGDPTEAALAVFSRKMGFKEDEAEEIFNLPFSYDTKFHAVVHKLDGKNFLSVAGAPEAVLHLSDRILRRERSEKLSHDERMELEVVMADLSRQGFRVIAAAFDAESSAALDPKDVSGLVFAGFYAMRDPLRPEVPEAMGRAAEAGIKVVMMTGDHRITAQAIAEKAGIAPAGGTVLTGPEIDSMTDEGLMLRLAETYVFARVTPEHKMRLIRLFRTRGDVVAMTGDGVNDAPSLAAADLGVAMGKIGTEVAKEAADLVLLNDDFGSIISAVEEGRSIYASIKKVILYLFSTNIGEVLVIGSAILLGLPLPILPVQIIWLNFVTDTFLDISLGLEPHDPDVLRRRFRKPSRFIVDGAMVGRMLFLGAVIALGTLLAFTSYLEEGMGKALTISLTTLAVFQWWNAWNCRHEDRSVFSRGFFANKALIGATILVAGLQMLAVYAPFLQNILHTEALSLKDWTFVGAISLMVVAAEEIRKMLFRTRVHAASGNSVI